MSANKHTSGPWVVRGGNEIIATQTGERIATVRLLGYDGIDLEEALHNAHLIVAAADLLDILERILGAHDTKNNGAYMGEAHLCKHYADIARAAIAKARGEA